MSRLPEPVRNAKAQLRPFFRKTTAARRSLPDFVIIGAQKAATTALMRYLREHPDVVAEPGVGEVHFFDRDWELGESFYRSSFPLRSQLRRRARRSGRVALTGEKTPYYMLHPLVPERAHQMIPRARLIAILRNPVDRAAAQHRMNFNAGVETLGLIEAIEAEPGRVDAVLERIAAGLDRGVGGPAQIYSYLARGRYAEQIDRWLQFFPREQLLLVRSEDLAADSEATYGTVLEFLGLVPHHPEFARHNAARRPYSVTPEAKALLEARFCEPNRILAEKYGITWEPGA